MIRYKISLALLCLIFTTILSAQSEGKFTLSGRIIDSSSGEDLISASIGIPEKAIGTVTNEYGFYSLTLPKGKFDIQFSYLGYETQIIPVDLFENIKLNIELSEKSNVIGEVVIDAKREKTKEHVASTEMGSVTVNIETVKKLPALFGEIDIIKTIQLLPGVKSIGEGSSGFFVRGGNVDQNLVLLDEAPIYNASHVLGFFSSFNPDAIKDMKLYKGTIPANYGGRLSSVLDIRMKEGNAKKFGLSGGIGTLMSRLAVEAPIGNNASFMLAGRRSYIDVVAKTVQAIRGKKSDEDNEFFFYDLNAKTNVKLGDSDRMFASGYFGRDVLGFSNDEFNSRVEWGNTTGTYRWNHIFSPKVFSNLTYYYSNYDYFFDFEQDLVRFKWDSNLREHSVKADFGIYVNPNNTLKFGAQTILHDIAPGDIESIEAGEIKQTFNIQKNKSYESAVYASNEHVVSDKLKFDYGLRFSMLNNVGPQEIYNLDENYEVIDTSNVDKGIYNTYTNFEPRFGMRYQLNEESSIKANYNRTAQYIQLASNGNFSTPFDIWFSSTRQIKPQLADQIGLGYFRNINKYGLSLSAEVYYRKFYNSIDFKDHAELLLNENLEGELRVGDGRAYGLELMAKKNTGTLTGWISYTYSKTQKQIPTINNGNWYNAKQDKPHDFSLVAIFEADDRVSLGTNFVYSTGSPVTLPTGRYDFGGVPVPVYSERNAARLPDFYRLDFSITIQSKKNKNRRFQSECVISLYNVLGRKNAFAINFKQEENDPNVTYAEKQSIFGRVPSFTYNIKF